MVNEPKSSSWVKEYEMDVYAIRSQINGILWHIMNPFQKIFRGYEFFSNLFQGVWIFLGFF